MTFLSKLPPALRVSVWLVIMPLLMAAAGAWVWHANRADIFVPTAAEQRQIDRLESILDDIRGNPRASVTVDGRRYGNPLATQMVERRLRELRHETARDSTVRALAPWARGAGLVAVAIGIGAALIGLAGMIMVRLAARGALRSREKLLAAFSRWQTRLPRYLGVLLTLLTTGFLALTLVACIIGYEQVILSNGSGNAFKLHLILILAGGFLTWGSGLALFRLARTLKPQHEPMEVLGRDLSAAEAPGLWAFVRDLAAKVGTAPPDNIVLGVVSSYYVTAHDIVLKPHDKPLSGRTMHLPLSYMTLLSPQENTAVLAHELGHFVGADTEYSLKFSPIYAGMIATLMQISKRSDNEWAKPATAFTAYLIDSFDAAVKHWSRLREFEADKVAARLAGGRAVATSLVRITVLDEVVNDYLDRVARRPDEAGEDFIARLADAVGDAPLKAPNLSAEAATAHPLDTHPPTLQRMGAVGRPPTDDLIQEALAEPVNAEHQAWVRNLFADSQTLQAQLLADFKHVARENNAVRREMLTGLAAQGGDRVELYHSRWLVFLFGGLAAVFAFGTVFAFLGNLGKTPRESMILTAVAGGAFIAFFALFIVLIKARRRPFLVLSGGELLMPGLARAVAWGDIYNFEMTTSNATVTIKFNLNPRTPDHGRTGGYIPGFKYKNGRSQIVVTGFGVQGMSSDKLFALLEKYQTAAAARQELQRM
ncbi:Protease HtpX [bacterium YEK0313]|nr:Protease HtpX [bacterium YEK0313]